ncbi:hypothetical protein CCACVL1_07876, partial [Corchorus capsularis]
ISVSPVLRISMAPLGNTLTTS